MADRRQTSKRQSSAYRKSGVYVDGSTARRLEEVPSYAPRRRRRTESRRKRAAVPEKQARLSEQARRNREKAMEIGKGYVVFLAVVCILILGISIHYLQLQYEITSRKKTVSQLESSLNQLKEENDAYYSQVTSETDLNEIRKTAIGRLGMKLPEEDQVWTYETEGRSYVRQFQDVPDE